MASSDLILGLLLFFSFLTFTGLCQDGSGVTRTLPCLEMLIPCQNYLHTPTPPQECCAPLDEMLLRNTACICSVIFNDALATSFNVTIEELLTMPTRCGVDPPDPSICSTFDLPTINLTPQGSPTATGGSSESSRDSKKFLTSAVAMLVVSRMLLFTHAF